MWYTTVDCRAFHFTSATTSSWFWMLFSDHDRPNPVQAKSHLNFLFLSITGGLHLVWDSHFHPFRCLLIVNFDNVYRGKKLQQTMDRTVDLQIQDSRGFYYNHKAWGCKRRNEGNKVLLKQHYKHAKQLNQLKTQLTNTIKKYEPKNQLKIKQDWKP